MGCNEQNPTETQSPVAGPDFAKGAGGTSLNVDLDQCANLATPCAWQNGDLNGNNSAYAEGDVVPFRFAIEGLSGAGTHSIHINYDFTAGGNKAYDFLASVDNTETVALCAAGGGGVSSLCPSLPTPDAKDWPGDTFNDANDGSGSVNAAITDAAAVLATNGRQLKLYGGSIITITAPVHSPKTDGNSTGDMTVTFNTGSCTSNCAVLFTWGGHLAKSSFWKNADATPDGAGEVSGAPWHMRTQQLDGSGNKNQDRSIQPSAIVETHPSLSLTKTPSATDVCGSGTGTSVTYTYVVSNTGDVTLSGTVTDDNGTPADNTDDFTVGSFNLAPGASTPSSGAGTLTKTKSITATTTNTATASAAFGTGTVTATASATVNAHTCTISITKTPDKTQVCSDANNSVTYTYVVSNTGDFFTASGSVTDDNGTPADNTDDFTVGSFTNLAAGASTPSSGTGTLTSGPKTITATTTNTATASGTSGGKSVSATTTATVTVVTCGISITKTPDKTQVCNGAGATVTYTYVVTNNSGTGFDADNGTVSDDNGTPADNTDDVQVGTFTDLAPGASTPSSGAGAITHTFTVNGTTTNTATASATVGGATVTATDDATVTGVTCGQGLLAPTQTSCAAFATGTSTELEPLSAQIQNGLINSVAPGVFFYYVKFTAAAGDIQVAVDQHNDTPGISPMPDFQVQNGQAFLSEFKNGTCTTKLTLSGATDPSGTLSNAPAGTYVIGIKYGTDAIKGQPINGEHKNETLRTFYFSAAVNGSNLNGSEDSDVLIRK
jgi:hypothetical protein